MADKTITALTISSLMIGLLLMSMLSAYILLVNNEGRGEIFDNFPEIEEFNLNLTNAYTDGELLDTANINSNLSATYNPEIAISAADQSGNAISINLQNLITITWTMLGVLGSLLFGNVYRGVISGLVMAVIAYLVVARFIKGIRTGDL